MSYVDVVKPEPTLTVSGFVNEMVAARISLGSINDAVFPRHSRDRSWTATSHRCLTLMAHLCRRLSKASSIVRTSSTVRTLLPRSTRPSRASRSVSSVAARVILLCAAPSCRGPCLTTSDLHWQGLRSLTEPSRSATIVAVVVTRRLAADSYWSATTVARPATGRTTGRTGSERGCWLGISARGARCKACGDHYSADCPAKAKANSTQAEIIAAVAAEFGKQHEAEQSAAGWRKVEGPAQQLGSPS